MVLFHIKPREDIDQAEYEHTFERILELVSRMDEFQKIEGFTGEDGSELAVAHFDSDEALQARKQHPEHLKTQERRRIEFFAASETLWPR